MSIRSVIRPLALGALTAAITVAAPVIAQPFPTKPIRMVVPFPPGGGTDTMARMFAEKMAEDLGQPILVENKSGAATIIGTDFVAKAPADGYTMWFGPSTSFVTNRFFYPNLPYNPATDLKLIYKVAEVPQVLVVNPSVKAKNAMELLKYIKKNKGKVNYGSYGIGSYPHLAGAYMSAAQDADMNHVAYKGEAPMMVDLLNNNIQMTTASFMGVKQHVATGKLNAIGITGERRVQTMADVPTLKEQGLDDDAYRVVGWIGMAMPAATSEPVMKRIHQSIVKAANSPDLRKRALEMGYDVITDSSAEAFKVAFDRDFPVWKKLVEQSGAKLE
ncbi:MAG: tripartite tricarboxylate transporter substrate binding protein [Burkholderiaceae bacterium]